MMVRVRLGLGFGLVAAKQLCHIQSRDGSDKWQTYSIVAPLIFLIHFRATKGRIYDI